MSEPELGKTAYNKRLDSIQRETGAIVEAIHEISENDDDMTKLERLTLLMTCLKSALKINEDTYLLREFGRFYKETGEFNARILGEQTRK